MLVDPSLGLRTSPFDVCLEVVTPDAVVAAGTDLCRAELAAAEQGISLRQADVELLGDLPAGKEASGHVRRVRIGIGQIAEVAIGAVRPP